MAVYLYGLYLMQCTVDVKSMFKIFKNQISYLVINRKRLNNDYVEF